MIKILIVNFHYNLIIPNTGCAILIITRILNNNLKIKILIFLIITIRNMINYVNGYC